MQINSQLLLQTNINWPASHITKHQVNGNTINAVMTFRGLWCTGSEEEMHLQGAIAHSEEEVGIQAENVGTLFKERKQFILFFSSWVFSDCIEVAVTYYT